MGGSHTKGFEGIVWSKLDYCNYIGTNWYGVRAHAWMPHLQIHGGTGERTRLSLEH